MGQGGKCPVKPLGCVNVTNITCKTKTLETNGKLVSREVCKLLFSVVKRAFNSQHYNTLHFCIEAVRYGLDDISNKRLKFKDVPGIKQPLKITKVKFTLYQPMPLDFLSVPIISIEYLGDALCNCLENKAES